MTAEEVRALVEEEINGEWSKTNAHDVDLRRSLVPPRKTACSNTFPLLNNGNDLDLWIVLEEVPGTRDGYLIVFDDQRTQFGLADWGSDGRPVFLGFHGGFLDVFEGM